MKENSKLKNIVFVDFILLLIMMDEEMMVDKIAVMVDEINIKYSYFFYGNNFLYFRGAVLV